MRIIDLDGEDRETVHAAAEPEDQTPASDLLCEAGTILGWIGAIPQVRRPRVQLHPLVVRSDCRHRGIGRAVLADLEDRVRERGGLTIWLGTDDEDYMTSLGGVALFPNVLERLMNIRNLRGHPYEFYRKIGCAITGVLPDANGPGKPDLYMAKSVR
ncbi:MAG: GNAT family N-acetyltransferase [Proteobacteria bacterium]|nr:GNAT family N-acetyltransferase [Pseudomonadota bacterium]